MDQRRETKMVKNTWIVGAYLVGITSMLMTEGSFAFYALISVLFYATLTMSYKGDFTYILHASILAGLSSVLFHWWIGSPFVLISLAAMSTIPAITIAAEQGEIFYQKNKIKAIFYYKQLGISLMFPIVAAVLLSIIMKDDVMMFTAYVLLYASMAICMRLTRRVIVYNIIFILAQLGVWMYVCTYLGQVSLVLKWAFVFVLFAVYGMKMNVKTKIRR